ncbi:MAG: prepilin-type N-terminal cleavage/methylation domain-containing protein [Deltaproteobacteria bacterium]|nr:MAG: prepilin-type N-terminal cleavage/methylation domain-containing protein [Deltaproteobacteria bacterium]
MFKNRHYLLASRGFTLVELVVTIMVMAVLLTVAIPTYSHYHKKARMVECQVSVVNFLEAQDLYYVDTARFWPLGPFETGAATKTIGWGPGSRPDQAGKYKIPELGIEFRREPHRGYRISAQFDKGVIFNVFLDFRLRTDEGFHNDGSADYQYQFRMYNRQSSSRTKWSTNGQWKVRNNFWFEIFGCPAWQWSPPCTR